MKDTPLRKTGIKGVGDIPWGTHFSQFYHTKEDLKEIFVPYFKAGLENNEYCLWISSSPLDSKEAAESLGKILQGYDQYTAKEQIKIVTPDEWYFKEGVFNQDNVLIHMIREINQAMVKGYEGMRIAGNSNWPEIRSIKQAFDYEAAMNNIVHKYRMVALCAYSLDACEIEEAVKVASNHEFVLIRKGENWAVIENSVRKNIYNDICQLSEKYKSMIESARDGIFAISTDLNFIYLNPPFELLTGWMRSEWINRPFVPIVHPDDLPEAMNMIQNVLNGQKTPIFELRILARSGAYVRVEIKLSPQIYDGMVISILGIGREIEETKQT